jgi:DNA-binding NtrC family response regulator
VRLGKTVLALLPLAEGGIEPDNANAYGSLVGGSLAMRRLFSILRRLEDSEAPVLIRGETGTGKELVARSIHEQSARRAQPFVVLDCGAIARDLIDSELFGHVRGAFTGAVENRAGVFEQASGGTLFLDEIGELPVELQPRLLRVLESGELRRVGGDENIAVDIRVIAATHRDLRAAIGAETFREDLYYRLAVVAIDVPPLRERLEDVPWLARHLADQIKPGAELPDAVVNLMSGHHWPGNVRELRNAVYQVLSLGRLELPTAERERAGPAVDANLPYKEARDRLLQEFEAEYVRALIERHDGNISQAAREAGIARQYFRELLRKHGLYEPS